MQKATNCQWTSNKWRHSGKIADQWKKVSLCRIGLVKDHGVQLVNQPRLSLYD